MPSVTQYTWIIRPIQKKPPAYFISKQLAVGCPLPLIWDFSMNHWHLLCRIIQAKCLHFAAWSSANLESSSPHGNGDAFNAFTKPRIIRALLPLQPVSQGHGCGTTEQRPRVKQARVGCGEGDMFGSQQWVSLRTVWGLSFFGMSLNLGASCGVWSSWQQRQSIAYPPEIKVDRCHRGSKPMADLDLWQVALQGLAVDCPYTHQAFSCSRTGFDCCYLDKNPERLVSP